MRPKRLVAKHRGGAGFEIYADLPETVECVEFTMKAMEQLVAGQTDADFATKEWIHPVKINLKNVTIGFEPFIQFPHEKWNKMIGEVFTEMVDLWNEKYAVSEDTDETNNEM